MKYDELVEQIAFTIYQYKGGVHPEEYTKAMGSDQRLWQTLAPWDSQPSIELCEHERDGFRLQARKVLDSLFDQGLLNMQKIDIQPLPGGSYIISENDSDSN